MRNWSLHSAWIDSTNTCAVFGVKSKRFVLGHHKQSPVKGNFDWHTKSMQIGTLVLVSNDSRSSSRRVWASRGPRLTTRRHAYFCLEGTHLKCSTKPSAVHFLEARLLEVRPFASRYVSRDNALIGFLVFFLKVSFRRSFCPSFYWVFLFSQKPKMIHHSTEQSFYWVKFFRACGAHPSFYWVIILL